MELVPTILTNDPGEARRMLAMIRKDGRFKRVQIDFIDGEYTNNKTILPSDVDLTLYLIMDFDAHLMVTEKNIDSYLRQADKVGFDRIIVQAESVSNPEKFTGLALDIHSPLETIAPYLGKLEVVTLMSIEPGFGGQQFNDKVIEKVKLLIDLRIKNNWKFKVQVDGGVQKELLEVLEKAGVDEVAVGVNRLLGDGAEW
jgi:pentose-5-phosphate-3-epimerase